MKKKKVGFELTVYDTIAELSAEDALLMNKAEEAIKSSHSPYSNFRVGAAVVLESGAVVLGSNQENASFPAGLCAEGVAVFSAGANYPEDPIKAIAITSFSEEHQLSNPAAPCGICRQAIAEYEQKQNSPITIIMKGEVGPIYKCGSIADLLPLGFDNSFLKDS